MLYTHWSIEIFYRQIDGSGVQNDKNANCTKIHLSGFAHEVFNVMSAYSLVQLLLLIAFRCDHAVPIYWYYFVRIYLYEYNANQYVFVRKMIFIYRLHFALHQLN